MRINVELDDALIREARKLSRAKTDRGLIEEALATFIEVETARRQREAYAERLQEVSGQGGEAAHARIPDGAATPGPLPVTRYCSRRRHGAGVVSP